jgi:two-component system, OmpR family, sensor histidine kinase VicK
MPSNMASEQMEVANGAENAVKLALQIISGMKKTLDCCFEHTGPSVLDSGPIWNEIIQLKDKGIRLRFITDVRKENMSYFTKIMRYVDVGHIDRVTGNFGISNGTEYLGYIIEEGGQLAKLLHINIRSFVEAQQYLFDNLWNNAIPVRERIKEIEESHKRQFIETIREPLEIQKLAHNLLESATFEILLLYPTANTFRRAENEGILESLEKAADHGVRVRILVQMDDENSLKEILQKKLKERYGQQISIQYMRRPLQNKITTLIIDQAVCLAVEVNDDAKETFEEAMGMATCSNSESTVSSNVSIFETLWIQSELDNQNRIKQVYFQLFKGFKLKDENYNRTWSAEKRRSD